MILLMEEEVGLPCRKSAAGASPPPASREAISESSTASLGRLMSFTSTAP
jgi:hypothetical protein